MTDRPGHVEITATVRSDSRRVAMPVHSPTTTWRLEGAGHLDEIPSLEWTWVSHHEAGDLAMTGDGIRLVTARTREVVDTHLGPDDEIQWLPGTVTLADGTALAYWLPHFPALHDLLNRELPTFGPSGVPIRYVLSRAKLAGHAVTALPNHPLTTIVSTPVADALVELGVVGIDFMGLAIGP